MGLPAQRLAAHQELTPLPGTLTADDARKGGDIDLLIETQLQDPAQIARAHAQFLARVYLALGEQKIDVRIDYPSRQSQAPIYPVAKLGVLL